MVPILNVFRSFLSVLLHVTIVDGFALFIVFDFAVFVVAVIIAYRFFIRG